VREDTYPRGLTILKGAVPGLARGLGHTAPTYSVGSRDRRPTAIAAPRIQSKGFWSFPLTTATATAKADLRRAALMRRKAVNAEARAAFAARLANEGLGLAESFQARGVSAFYPIGDEPDTLPLLATLAEHGFVTMLPVTVSRSAPLDFRLWRPGDPKTLGAMKIPEPSSTAQRGAPDLLFTPLACFDRQGWRIGYGGGHYDRTLKALRAEGRALAVGVAYESAECPALPHEPHDEPLDFVLTEDELIDCRGH
jgi:5-formyltetrahydrofolate cyclo-ligase